MASGYVMMSARRGGGGVSEGTRGLRPVARVSRFTAPDRAPWGHAGGRAHTGGGYGWGPA